jgi:hypothetical protein
MGAPFRPCSPISESLTEELDISNTNNKVKCNFDATSRPMHLGSSFCRQCRRSWLLSFCAPSDAKTPFHPPLAPQHGHLPVVVNRERTNLGRFGVITLVQAKAKARRAQTRYMAIAEMYRSQTDFSLAELHSLRSGDMTKLTPMTQSGP